MLTWADVWSDKPLRTAMETMEREIIASHGPIGGFDEALRVATAEVAQRRATLVAVAADFAARNGTPFDCPHAELLGRLVGEQAGRVSMGLRAAGRGVRVLR